jgi:hypothetical protein
MAAIGQFYVQAALTSGRLLQVNLGQCFSCGGTWTVAWCFAKEFRNYF